MLSEIYQQIVPGFLADELEGLATRMRRWVEGGGIT